MQLIDIPNFEKVAGAEVAVGVRRGVVRIEVEEPVVRVVVIVAADIGRVERAVRVDAVPGRPQPQGTDSPRFTVTLVLLLCYLSFLPFSLYAGGDPPDLPLGFQEAGAEVAVGERRGDARIEVEEPVARVAVIVAADIGRVERAARVDAVTDVGRII